MITVSSKKSNLLVIPTYEKKKKVTFFDTKKNGLLKKNILKEIKEYHFESKNEEALSIKLGKQKVLLIGLKEKPSTEEIRRAYSIVFKVLKSKKELKSTIEVPIEKEEGIKAVVEGLDLTNYSFDKYLSEKNKDKFTINLDVASKFSSLVKKSLILTQNVKLTRDMVNTNADEMVPKKIESMSKAFAKKNKLKIKVLNEKDIQKQKLGLLWAVGQGSVNPPRLIIIEYNGKKKSKEKIALVGKGITFDTGGLNLKPTGYMEDMKTDMAGSATAFNTFKAAVELKLKKNIICVLCCAENAIGARAYKPGDVFKSYKGITVEITNTDAEGRLVLADGISYVQKYYKPTQIIDMATLTGACMVALGMTTAGIFSNDEKMVSKLKESSENSGESSWHMPILEEHRKALKSKIADCINCDLRRYGGASTAAAFLEKFVEEKVKWTHLDIAGPAWGKSEDSYNPSMGTGKGVRLLVNYLSK